MLGTPILSWLKDYSNDYLLTFEVSGCLMILSGGVLALWPFFKDSTEEAVTLKRQEEQKNEKTVRSRVSSRTRDENKSSYFELNQTVV